MIDYLQILLDNRDFGSDFKFIISLLKTDKYISRLLRNFYYIHH